MILSSLVPDSSYITVLKKALATEFQIYDLGALRYFLGLEFKSLPTDLHASGPMFTDASLYRQLVGSLQYLTFTCPDITFSVNRVSQFMQHTIVVHYSAVKRILRYLNGTKDLSILFQNSALTLSAFCDADWARDAIDRRSTTGFVAFLGSSIISWSTKKQHTVSRSSIEAEYRSLATTTADLYWQRQHLCDLYVYLKDPPILWCDNVSAISLASNLVFHARTKHIEIDYHFVREKVVRKDISVRFVSSKDQIADLFTKALSTQAFLSLRSKLMFSVQP
ncbi:uncharacterized protein LOC111021968 [Momordica charantia]|uniref:Uncharacterized protein LOC111021968 n=1 Tax=Momordica charantia TaxID=3673 RepID=A0A6J1DMP1_MOMCH|nr:uncharacterized protein LOC111021968 [Momordica charantia]